MTSAIQQAPTIAEQISAQLEDDGQRFETRDGRSFDDLISAARPRTDTDGFDNTRYVFSDGSVITLSGAAWDLGYPDCYCWQGAGHHCEEIDR